MSMDPLPLARDNVDQLVLLLVLRDSSSGCPLPCEGVCDLASRALCPQPPYTDEYAVICKCGLPGCLWLIGCSRFLRAPEHEQESCIGDFYWSHDGRKGCALPGGEPCVRCGGEDPRSGRPSRGIHVVHERSRTDCCGGQALIEQGP